MKFMFKNFFYIIVFCELELRENEIHIIVKIIFCHAFNYLMSMLFDCLALNDITCATKLRKSSLFFLLVPYYHILMFHLTHIIFKLFLFFLFFLQINLIMIKLLSNYLKLIAKKSLF